MSSSQLYAGTSGWAYPTWKPDFYPEGLPSRKFLEYYASRLTSVEVNYTFRKLPSEKQLQGWLADTPEGFRFSFKAPQSITHLRRLRDCGELLNEFLSSLKPAVKAAKHGALLLQFPPNFRAESLGRDKQTNRRALAAFIEQSSPLFRLYKWPATVEFRDAGWFADETYALLRKHNVALCLAESDELNTPEVATADFSYSRLRASAYTSSAMKMLLQRAAEQSNRGPAYVYFKHEDAPDGPLRAENMLKHVAGTRT